VVDKPVTQAIGVAKLEETATPGQRVLFDQMQQLQRRLDDMENANGVAVRQSTLFDEPDDTESLPSKFMRLHISWYEVNLAPKADPEKVAASIAALFPNAMVSLETKKW